ncbi:hypothetical protein CONPUDRAFT_165167 [Coniophora puteana RWD-64-598 SS2]|uniref:PH domain-containing protein n=1 Tax=Coniophora puteana (strain RWD-64-598) TaxID=741705 RepID=A0A5M3MPE5_CONPW|nr:uncharacterized protein CONPUDRAFT_165167 [Coniophora puteana RWD-64-598 SS2]EIW80926.1 hypothetical protein CONPUDRAFT_165167 [Coniophora puteana RWD-64-598 SS2]
MEETVSDVGQRNSFKPAELHSVSQTQTMPTNPESFPAAFHPYRYSALSVHPTDTVPDGHAKTRDSWLSDRARRSSVPASPAKRTKGKEPAIHHADESFAYDADTLVSKRYNPPSSFTTRDSNRDSLPHHPRKVRNSLFVAADAFTAKFGKKQHNQSPVPRPAPPQVLPDVIEISALRRDEELERERLRDAAAQSLGLGPELLHDSPPKDSFSDDESEMNNHEGLPMLPHSVNGDPITPTEPTHSSGFSSNGHRPTSMTHPYPGSLTQLGAASAATVAPVPAFPSTVSALEGNIQLRLTLPKFYPPSSLLSFALAKQWKTRHMIFSTPSPSSRNTGSGISYLHLFKSSSPDEKELERLAINDDSVIYISEEDVGGRGNVVKIGGVESGSVKKEINLEENGRTMWFVQIKDATEAQKWITSIKGAVLAQRTIRAGLAHNHAAGGSGPKGDMDVMLSMHLQGMVSPTNKRQSVESDATRSQTPDKPMNFPAVGHAPSSSHSSRTLSLASKGSGVSVLKGMFSHGRPRSRASSVRTTSIDTAHGSAEDSFTSVGNNLLSMLRPNTVGDASMSPTRPGTFPGPGPSHFRDFSEASRPTVLSDLKIVSNTEFSPSPVEPEHHTEVSSLPAGSVSLQPPPRKKFFPPSASDAPQSLSPLYSQSNGNQSVAGSFGVQSLLSVDSPRAGSHLTVTNYRERSSSIQSISTSGTGESDGNSKSRRWSRQSSTLPKRLTPPSGPVPPPPAGPHSRSSSIPASDESSPNTSPGPQLTMALSPNFWKRASASSAQSGETASTSNSRSPISPPGSTKRRSMPPPRPAPNFAPPPAPMQNGEVSSPASPTEHPPPHKSLRSTVAQRALRLSLSAPKPPPDSSLPPRPDEQDQLPYAHDRRDSSTPHHPLYSIPASPVPEGAVPSFIASSSNDNGGRPSSVGSGSASASSTRSISIKQRLRNLSAPASPPSHTLPPEPANASPASPTTKSFTKAPTPTPPPPTSVPPTPGPYDPEPQSPSPSIGERITNMQNDPNFLQMLTPTIPSATPPPAVPPRSPNRPSLLPERLSSSPEITSLSPPPRRGSRQISVIEKPADKGQPAPVDASDVGGESKLTGLSKGGSVVSLGFVSV